jgi:hypothetical protein
MKRPRLDGLVLYQGLLHLGAGTASAVGAFLLLTPDPTASINERILLAGLAGSFGSTLAPLFSGAFGWASRNGSLANSIGTLSPLLYAGLGFGSAAAAFLAIVALLLGSGAVPPAVGTAAFGALVGVATARVIGGWTGASIVPVGAERQGTGSPIVDTFGYLDRQLQDRLVGRLLVDYDGLLVAGWYPASSRPLDPVDDRALRTLGRIRLAFVPRKSADRQSPDELLRLPGSDSSEAVTITRGRVRVAGGVAANEAQFLVEVTTSSSDVFPQRLEIIAPTSKPSEAVEFTVLRLPLVESEGARPARHPRIGRVGSKPSPPTADQPELFVIEVSQNGTTVQLVELDTSLATRDAQMGR